MPKGPTHTRATLVITAGLVLTAPLYFSVLSPASLALIPGALSGLVITPDLDVRQGCYSHYLIRKYLGYIPYRLWFWLWWLYGRLIPHHRSWLSHAPILGTFFRIAYLIGMTGGCCLLIPAVITSPIFWYYCTGLAITDLLHEFMDLIT